LAKSRAQLMVERLRELQASSPDIEASAVVSIDGLPIASALPQGIEEDRVSAMSAAILAAWVLTKARWLFCMLVACMPAMPPPTTITAPVTFFAVAILPLSSHEAARRDKLYQPAVFGCFLRLVFHG